MPVAVLFDTLEYVRKLERAGVPAQQAEAQPEALADALGSAVATRDDLRAMETRLETRIASVEAKVDKLDARVDRVDARLDKLVGSVDLLKWLFGFLAATNIAMVLRIATQ